MSVKEEYVFFEYELSRLAEEYLNCHNLSLKQQIQEDIQLLEAAVEMVKRKQVEPENSVKARLKNFFEY